MPSIQAEFPASFDSERRIVFDVPSRKPARFWP
jgi:hypothetical protein